jgi:hypothetical protein
MIQLDRKLLIASTLTLCLVATAGCASSPGCIENFVPSSRAGTVEAGGIGACARNGTFILVRSANEVVAIRFTAVADSAGGRKDHGCARYELFSGDSRGFAKEARRGTLSTFCCGGVHPIALDPGHNRIRSGKLTLGYTHPACIDLMSEIPASSDSNPNVRYTLTPWTEIGEVDPADASLEWRSPDLTPD